MIKQATIEAVKAKIEIVDVVSEFVELKKTGSAYVGFSPFTEEKTPSFNVVPSKNLFKDFSSGNGGDAIEFLQKHQGFTFTQAIEWLANFYKIHIEYEGATTSTLDMPAPKISQRDATPDEPEGTWYFELRKEFTDFEIKTLLAEKVLAYTTKEGKIDKKKFQEIALRYNLYSLESYSIVKNRKITTIGATDDFPLYMFDEGKFKKLYIPLNKGRKKKDGSEYPRFLYYGERPKHFLHGLNACISKYNELNPPPEDLDDQGLDDDGDKKEAAKTKKLFEIIYCTGGSDGINVAMLGYQVVWPNGETEKLTEKQLKKLSGLAEKVMNLPDIDATGRREAYRMAMEHLEMYTLDLPADLAKRYDRRGKPCKDVRDYFRYHNWYDFKQLLPTALRYQFWDVDFTKTKSGKWKENYTVLNTELYNFLVKNGFSRTKINERTIYIHIQDNIVSVVDPSEIRDYVNNFLVDRLMSPRLRDAFYRSTQLNETSLANLPLVDVEFTNFDRDSQYFFFQDKTIRVTKDSITEFKPGDVDKFVWEEEVIKHAFKKQDPHFRIWKGKDDHYDIEILKKDNVFLNFLINTSRIHWRKELEDQLDGKKAEEIKAYKEKHRFNIAGPHLAPEEILEQKLHLINKIFTLGFLLHKYKDKSKNWAAFGMDARLSDSGESHGGTGKSLIYDAPNFFLSNEYLPGRDPKLTENKHLYEGITKHTFYVLVDDCAEYLNFDFFFDAITGKIKVNPKNTTQYTLEFKDVPKFAFTSNFSLRNQDSSTRRRLLFTVNSDFYHHNKDGHYREDWSPRDDFDMELLTEDMTAEQWNDFCNFMLQACQFYMAHPKVNPPMDEVEKRNLLAEMGSAFHEWADVYFSEDSDRINTLVPRPPAFEDFKRTSGSNRWSSQKFGKALKAWCRYYGYELNPEDLKNDQGRIVRREPIPGTSETKPTEQIYIRTFENVPEDIQPSLPPDGGTEGGMPF